VALDSLRVFMSASTPGWLRLVTITFYFKMNPNSRVPLSTIRLSAVGVEGNRAVARGHSRRGLLWPERSASGAE